MNTMNNTPAMPAATEQETPGTICIAPQGDGSFKVYMEAPGPETGGADEEGTEQASGKTAPDIDAALDMARGMLGGASGKQASNPAVDNLFEQGFNKARGIPLNRS